MSEGAKGEAKAEKREDADGNAKLDQGTLLDPLQKLGNSEMFGGNGAGEQNGEMKIPELKIQTEEKKADSARDGEKKKKRHHRHKGKEGEAKDEGHKDEKAPGSDEKEKPKGDEAEGGDGKGKHKKHRKKEEEEGETKQAETEKEKDEKGKEGESGKGDGKDKGHEERKKKRKHKKSKDSSSEKEEEKKHKKSKDSSSEKEEEKKHKKSKDSSSEKEEGEKKHKKSKDSSSEKEEGEKKHKKSKDSSSDSDKDEKKESKGGEGQVTEKQAEEVTQREVASEQTEQAEKKSDSKSDAAPDGATQEHGESNTNKDIEEKKIDDVKEGDQAKEASNHETPDKNETESKRHEDRKSSSSSSSAEEHHKSEAEPAEEVKLPDVIQPALTTEAGPSSETVETRDVAEEPKLSDVIQPTLSPDAGPSSERAENKEAAEETQLSDVIQPTLSAGPSSERAENKEAAEEAQLSDVIQPTLAKTPDSENKQPEINTDDLSTTSSSADTSDAEPTRPLELSEVDVPEKDGCEETRDVAEPVTSPSKQLTMSLNTESFLITMAGGVGRPESPQRDSNNQNYSGMVVNDEEEPSDEIPPLSTNRIESEFSDQELESALNRYWRRKQLPPVEMRRDVVSYARKASISAIVNEDYDRAAKLEDAITEIGKACAEDNAHSANGENDNLQQRLERAERDRKEIEQYWNNVIRGVKEQEQHRIREMEIRHENELRAFEEKWQQPESMAPFSKPSAQLLQCKGNEAKGGCPAEGRNDAGTKKSR